MSHIVTIKTEVRDAEAVSLACKRPGLEEPRHGTAQLFEGEGDRAAGQTAGLGLPRRRRHRHGAGPLRQLRGQWGDPSHLNAFVQSYAICKANLEARKRGHSVHETGLPDGSVKLTISVGGSS